MAKKKKNHPVTDLKFWSVCFFGSFGAYLVFIDHLLPLREIWNYHLWFLLGSFVFGFFYGSDFWGISFWLLFGLGAADLIKGITGGAAGISYLGGLVVCFLTIPAGLAGWGLSLLIPKNDKSVNGRNVKNS